MTPSPEAHPAKRRCPVYRESCPIHGFIHGAEAEELREGIEKLIASEEELGEAGALTDSLQRLLDRVDARDSVAYREATRRRR